MQLLHYVAPNRLNLALKAHLLPLESLVKKVRVFMKSLRTLKNSALLRRHGLKGPIISSEIIWNSAMLMIKRYFELLPSLLHEDLRGLKYLLPGDSENIVLIKILEDLDIFYSVSINLQNEKNNLITRILFDRLMVDFPLLEDKFKSTDFENALLKIAKGQVNSLSESEKTLTRRFKKLPIKAERLTQ